MTIVAETYTYVAGVDTHARTHTLSIIEAAHSKEVDIRTFPATPAGHARTASWLARRTNGEANVLISMEGTNSYGLTLRDHLERAGYRVIEAPRPDRARQRVKGKSDTLDALRTARATLQLRLDRLVEPKNGDTTTALRALATARNSMSKQRTAAINALTARLRTSQLGVDARKPLTTTLIKTIAAWRTRREGLTACVQRSEAIRLAFHSSLEDQTPIEAYTRSLPAAKATPILPGPSRPQAQVMSLC